MMIKCQDCKTEFEFTEEEWEWFENKFGADFQIPKRCKPCRKKRKDEKLAKEASKPNVEPSPRRTRRR